MPRCQLTPLWAQISRLISGWLPHTEGTHVLITTSLPSSFSTSWGHQGYRIWQVDRNLQCHHGQEHAGLKRLSRLNAAPLVSSCRPGCTRDLFSWMLRDCYFVPSHISRHTASDWPLVDSEKYCARRLDCQDRSKEPRKEVHVLILGIG